MLKYMYIDESGDLGLKSSKYMVISCLLVDSPAKLDRIIKNIRRYKFKKELKKAQEIKANKSSKDLIQYLLKKLNDVENAKVFYMVLEKKKMMSDYLKNSKNKLYNFIAGKLARNIILEEFDVEIRVDRSKGRPLLRKDFNQYFIQKLRERSSIRKIEIFHSYSHSWTGLQFADILAWACFQKFEHSNNEFIDLVKIDQEVYHTW